MNVSHKIQLFSVQFVPFILALTCHEYVRGLVAHYWGDSSAKLQGRLSLNPLVHIDPIGSIFFPLVNTFIGLPLFLGWAKPIPIYPQKFKNYRLGLFWVAFSGLFIHFLLAWVFSLLCLGIVLFLPSKFYFYQPLLQMATVGVPMNYSLGLFNLIPIPPLDGNQMLHAFLPQSWAKKYASFTPFSSFLLAVLLMSGVFSLMTPWVHLLSQWTFVTLDAFLKVHSLFS